MHISLRVQNSVFINTIYFFAYFVLLIWVNNNYVYQLYSYMGAEHKHVDGYLLAYIFVLALLSSALCGSRVSKPGDIVVLLLFLTIVPHALVLNGANIFYPEASSFSGLNLAVFLGVMLVALINKIKFSEGPDNGFHGAGYLLLISWINIIVLAFISIKSLSYLSFDFSEQYLRRSVAREVFSSGSLEGYIASIGTQAFFPIIFAWGVYKKSAYFFTLGIVNCLVLWAAFGQKYPFIVLVVVYIVMAYLRSYGKVSVSWMLSGAMGLLVLGVFEFELLNYSYLNDYLVRRIYIVPSNMLGAAELFFQDFGVNNYSDTALAVLTGDGKTETLPFRIGAYVYNNPETNANINFLALAYLRYGYVAAVIEAFIVGSLVMVLNFIYARRSMFIAMPVGLLLATKIVEQSLPTVMLGSGLFFMFLLLVLMSFSGSRTQPLMATQNAK